MKGLRLFLAMCMIGFAAGSHAQFWGAKAPSPFEMLPQQLKQGEFTWRPDLAPTGPILVVVSLTEQIAYTYRNGIMIGACKVSTGKKGHETPTGVFYTKYKDADHRSSKYNNAAMPYTQMVTSTGVALHAGGLPGYPSSHGCIHLPSEYARLLYKETPTGMTVVISNEGKSVGQSLHPSFVTPVNPKGKALNKDKLTDIQNYRWEPDTLSKGPLAIIISRYDQRVIIMRDGEEQGRAKIQLEQPDSLLGTHVLMAMEDYQIKGKVDEAVNKLPWIRLDHLISDKVKMMVGSDMMFVERIKVPTAFASLVQHEVLPGTTLVLTDAPVLKSTTGVDLALFTNKSPEQGKQ